MQKLNLTAPSVKSLEASSQLNLWVPAGTADTGVPWAGWPGLECIMAAFGWSSGAQVLWEGFRERLQSLSFSFNTGPTAVEGNPYGLSD